MDAEFSVELGADDPTLAVPWQSPDGKIAYIDLRQNPDLIDGLPEVHDFLELGELLHALNAPMSQYQTAKCDAWFDGLMDVDDEPYRAAVKCGGYVDVFFTGDLQAMDFPEHERRVREVVQRVHAAADLRARSELVVRRAYFGEEQGFYWTIYVFGYGNDLAGARESWREALAILRGAMAL